MRLAWLAPFMFLVGCAHHSTPPATSATSIDQVIASKRDIWGEAALARPEGPTYEFFRDLLPPLRYVDAPAFRCYPLVLSAPGALVKGRLLSDGSAVNPLARQPVWKNEEGIPVRLMVGTKREAFGEDLARLQGPSYAEGYLPIVSMTYRSDDGTYTQEAFAPVDHSLSKGGAILVNFTFPSPDHGRVDLAIEGGYESLKLDNRRILDASGKTIVAFDENWDWAPARNQLTSKLKHGRSAVAMIFTRAAATAPVVDQSLYTSQRNAAAARWRDIVNSGTQVTVPEDHVNRAWRSLICGTYSIIAGQMNYSAGNQYARQYSHESGESIRSMVAWGHAPAMRPLFKPLFAYHRPGIELHDAGFLLRDLADYYFATGDRTLVDDLRPMWQSELTRIREGRQKGEHGLLPRERYCSDIDTPVISISTNANCWRGMRDMAVVLRELGDTEEAAKLATEAADYRRIILDTIDKAWDRTTDPPFLPLAIGEEPAHDPITATRLGSYWNLVIHSLTGSGILAYDSQGMTDVLRYIREKGGLCMGLVRVQSARVAWINPQNIDDLYGGRYALKLLERDEPDLALVCFYGKLAQGMTRDTFYDGESSSIVPLDQYGRHMGLPPNSTANASFLLQLRNLLVQDWDLDDDGRAETLRLLFATPRAWMEDGKQITVESAVTEFGVVSLKAKSELARGRVNAEVRLPAKAPKKVLIRFRVPRGWKVLGANVGSRDLMPVGDEAFDMTGLTGTVNVEVWAGRVK